MFCILFILLLMVDKHFKLVNLEQNTIVLKLRFTTLSHYYSKVKYCTKNHTELSYLGSLHSFKLQFLTF